MLEAAARVNGRMKARGQREMLRSIDVLHRAVQFRVEVPSLTQADALDAAMTRPKAVLSGRDRAGDPEFQTRSLTTTGETGGYLARRAWNIRNCGKMAVGVGLLRARGVAGAPGEKVYHATCKDRLCPICNAKAANNGAQALKKLMRGQVNEGQRLFFATVTVQHTLQDGLRATRKVLDRGYARLIRTKWFKDTFDERLRCAEVEYTRDNGWHPHFHLLLRLRPGCKAWHWSHDRIEAQLKNLWRRCTSREFRPSWQVDMRELVVHARDQAGEVTELRYWLRPAERRRYELLAKAGKVRLHRRGPALYRVQTVDDVVEELTKYVTKRSASGLKPNQVPLWDWSDTMLHEYALGIRYWNLRRASKGWEQLLIEFQEDEQLAREIEADQAGGYEYFPWAEIIAQCRLAGSHLLTGDEADQFAADYPRILKALDREGCEVAVDMIRGWIFRFFGDLNAELRELKARPFERGEHQAEKAAKAAADSYAEGAGRFKARHWRVLMRLRRRHDAGNLSVKLGGLGMSKRRLRDVVDELQAGDLVRPYITPTGAVSRGYELTEVGRRLLKSAHVDPRKKHELLKRGIPETHRQAGLFEWATHAP